MRHWHHGLHATPNFLKGDAEITPIFLEELVASAK